jgi:maltodextrin utilization protein YvdJ
LVVVEKKYAEVRHGFEREFAGEGRDVIVGEVESHEIAALADEPIVFQTNLLVHEDQDLYGFRASYLAEDVAAL